jgi:hypothetical protein
MLYFTSSLFSSSSKFSSLMLFEIGRGGGGGNAANLLTGDENIPNLRSLLVWF